MAYKTTNKILVHVLTSFGGVLISFFISFLSIIIYNLVVIESNELTEIKDIWPVLVAILSILLAIVSTAFPTIAKRFILEKGDTTVCSSKSIIDLVNSELSGINNERKLNDSIYSTSALIIPGLYQSLILKKIKDSNELAKTIETIRRMASNYHLKVTAINEKLLKCSGIPAWAKKDIIKLLKDLKKIKKEDGSLKHSIYDLEESDFPNIEMLYLNDKAFIKLNPLINDTLRLKQDSLFSYVIENQLKDSLTNTWVSTVSNIKNVVDHKLFLEIKNICNQITIFDLYYNSFHNSEGFFEVASKAYDDLVDQESCYIINETARPEPAIINSFRETDGYIKILWIQPEQLMESSEIEHWCGALYREILKKELNKNGVEKLQTTPIVKDEIRLKVVIVPDNKVICGSQISLYSTKGLILTEDDWIKSFTKKWEDVQKNNSKRKVMDVLNSLLQNYIQSNKIKDISSFKKSQFWFVQEVFFKRYQRSFETKKIENPIEQNIFERAIIKLTELN